MPKIKANSPIKKRNPFARLAWQRHAGAHRKSNKAMRQKQRQVLRRSLKNDDGFIGSSHQNKKPLLFGVLVSNR